MSAPTIELSQVPNAQYDARQSTVFEMSAKNVRICSCDAVSDAQYTRCNKCGNDLSKRTITEQLFLTCDIVINVKTSEAQSICNTRIEIRADDGILFTGTDGIPVKAIDMAKKQVSAMGFDLTNGWEPVITDIARVDGKIKVFRVDVKSSSRGTKYVQISTGAAPKVALTGDKRAMALAALNALSGIRKNDPEAF